MNISSEQLDQALFALNDQLALRRGRVHLIVIGGSGLIAIEAVSRATRDVDVVALKRDGELVSADPLPTIVRDAAAIVARDLGKEANWLNAGPTGPLLHGLPAGFVERLLTRDCGVALQVSFA